MRLPNKKKPGDPIRAEDWNLLLDAIAARTPRPGDGLKFISSSGGFAYSCPGSPSGQPGQPPFSVIGIAKAGGGYKVTIKEGWVIERLIKSGTSPAVKFWISKYSGTALNATPRPQLTMSLGDTAFCRVQCAVDGLITGDPTIVVSSATQNGQPYYPVDPDASGQTGDYYVKLFTLASDAGTPKVTVYQQSDIEHWAQLWTGKNVGAEARVFKEHDETDNKYAFRTIRGENGLIAEEDGDIIKVYIEFGANMNISVVYASFDGDGHKVVESREVACVIYVRNGVIIGITDPQDNAPNLIEVDVSLVVKARLFAHNGTTFAYGSNANFTGIWSGQGSIIVASNGAGKIMLYHAGSDSHAALAKPTLLLSMTGGPTDSVYGNAGCISMVAVGDNINPSNTLGVIVRGRIHLNHPLT